MKYICNEYNETNRKFDYYFRWWCFHRQYISCYRLLHIFQKSRWRERRHQYFDNKKKLAMRTPPTESFRAIQYILDFLLLK